MSSPRAVEPWHRRDAAEVLRSLGTSPDVGLKARDAREKLGEIGPNEIEPEGGYGVLRLFAHQFADVMIALLIAAAIISGWLGDVIDTVAIVVIVALNATVGVIQEYRAQHAITALRQMRRHG